MIFYDIIGSTKMIKNMLWNSTNYFKYTISMLLRNCAINGNIINDIICYNMLFQKSNVDQELLTLLYYGLPY